MSFRARIPFLKVEILTVPSYWLLHEVLYVLRPPGSRCRLSQQSASSPLDLHWSAAAHTKAVAVTDRNGTSDRNISDYAPCPGAKPRVVF